MTNEHDALILHCAWAGDGDERIAYAVAASSAAANSQVAGTFSLICGTFFIEVSRTFSLIRIHRLLIVDGSQQTLARCVS